MINDKNWVVREAVAYQGYCLNVLINDEHWEVRKAIADQGYGLNILVNDEDWKIRAAVAKQGYGLDILINDNKNAVFLFYCRAPMTVTSPGTKPSIRESSFL